MSNISPTRFAIDPASLVPLYYQIRENLRELIRSGDLPPGEIIPSERELSEYYNVNRLTVRQAVTELVREGLLRRQHGIGTFVQNKLTHEMPTLAGFTERMSRLGHKPGSRLISLTHQSPTRSAAHQLHIPLDGKVVKIVRLRLLDEQPFMLETAFLREDLVPNLQASDLEHEPSLYRVLTTRYNIQITEAEEVLEPVLLTSYEASLLETEPGRPALLIEGVVYEGHGLPFEVTTSLLRGDKSRVYFHLHRQGVEVERK
jgi:GntR family transcriptional regulator